MNQRLPFFVLLLLSLVFVPFGAAQEDRLQIVGSHSILTDVIMNVAGDAADVTSVMPLGADPHSFQPTPSDLTALADADVVFINGMFFEEGLLEAIENAGDEMNIVVASSCVEIVAFGGSGHDHGDDEHMDDEHGDDHDHGDDEHGDDHDHGDDEHGDDEHMDDEHGDDEHMDDEHGDDEHMDDEHMDDEHGDDEHMDDEHMEEMSAIASLCEQHYAEMAALHGDDEHMDDEHMDDEHGDDHDHDHDHDNGKVETLGALYAIDCGAGHGHDEHSDEEHSDDDHSDEEHGDEDAHDHGEGSCDPHVWMEPHNVMFWTMLIRDTLIEMDPANADTYTANAAAYLEAVDALAHDFVMPMVETLPEENRILITNHDAFGYFAVRYEFEVLGTIIPSFSTLAEASAGDVAEIIDQIREENVPAIFAETTVSDELAQQIADETGVTVEVLYSGSLSEADGPASTYIDYIRYNVTTIVEGLGGGMPMDS